ncbi:P-loop containing nucleoside triphosphate hydrolase protein [Achaetomium macrosporum]|uniref:P-loop containing nucleoside triphosphate hydrolase protein n=1 Tax=Achaetomium macrosporum TaxID=79813 RepID=A0AAN7CFD4_9PEZI|nr:P-loop containing nucleoside triphosphate hydrolase protein [Achaetomium macrosporum]
MEEHSITILLLGDERCGKSTFLSRISLGRPNLRGTTPITLLRDIDQPFPFEIRSRKGQYRFEFYDTSSPENWRLLRPDLIIICYDISQRLSLINLQRVVCTFYPNLGLFLINSRFADAFPQWIKEVRATFASSDTLPVLVLGLKRDLRSEDDPNGIIYPQEAYRVAQEMRADKYMECSAVTGELMEEVFDDICTTALKTTTPDGGQSEGGCSIM